MKDYSSKPLFSKLFKDDRGKIVIGQRPNLPLIVWFVAMVLGWVITGGVLAKLFSVVGFGSIFTWAYLEIFQGVNYFRRILGVVVMALIVIPRIS